MSLHVDDPDFQLHVGSATDVLRTLPDESVHCVVTSPPYWGLRDYGTGTWEGGDPDCDHRQETRHQQQGATSQRQGRANAEEQRNENFRDVCGKCGARRVDRQLGLEPTPEEYVARMVEVFREVRRVLRADGTCWLNIGDSYVSDPGKGGSGTPTGRNNRGEGYARERMAQVRDGEAVHGDVLRPFAIDGLPPKNLVGIPWRLALALQADGWFLRSEIIWAKKNCMPESVTDRPTKSHEQVFLLTRSPRYYFDQEAIREPHQPDGRLKTVHDHATPNSHENHANIGLGHERWPNGGRNARSVWEIATQPYAEAHFATFPEELPRRCIVAGCPADGTVLDPFMGSGTVALVARRLGRHSIGIELNPAYADLAARRLQQQSLFA